MAGTDIALGVGYIIVDTGYRDKWQQSEEGKTILEFWDGVNLLYAGGRITQALYSSAQAARTSAGTLKNSADDAERAILEETEQQADDIVKAGVGNEVRFTQSTGNIANHIVEADFNALKPVTTAARSEGRAVNSVTKLVNTDQALVIKPIENSPLAKKMDEYINAFQAKNTNLQGEIGEEMSEMLAKDIDNTTVLNMKINESNNGFDVMQFENGLENTTKVRIFESKPLNNNSIVLPSTSTKGTQMSNQWTNTTIQEMIENPSSAINEIGNILKRNDTSIEKYVFTVDKDLKQIIIMKLDNF